MTRMSTSVTKFAIGAIVLVALAAGCRSKTGTKAGKTPVQPVVLHAAGFDDVPAAEYFRKRVAQLSDGALRVEIGDQWDNLKADREQHWVSLVADGTADLGWVNTWTFDTLGVTRFQALTAPMLIDSYPLEKAVLASTIPDTMLPHLAALKVKGLALLADELRKPIAVKRPLLQTADWRGLKVAIARSHVKSDALAGLRAVPVPVGWDDQPALLRSGKVQATETNLRRYSIQGLDFYAPYVTQNVNLWPGVIALIANPRRLAKLSDEQRAWLDQAAKDASARATELVQRQEPPLLASLCKSGARFATASPAQLAALRDAFAPAVQRLERDPETKAFVNQILRLKRSTLGAAAHPIPRACRAAPAAVSGNPNSALNGVYRVSFTEQELLAGGAKPGYARYQTGVATLTFRDGRYVFLERNRLAIPGGCRGPYQLRGKRIFADLNVKGCHGTLRAAWSLRNGWLRFSNIVVEESGDPVFWESKPWKKIG